MLLNLRPEPWKPCPGGGISCHVKRCFVFLLPSPSSAALEGSRRYRRREDSKGACNLPLPGSKVGRAVGRQLGCHVARRFLLPRMVRAVPSFTKSSTSNFATARQTLSPSLPLFTAPHRSHKLFHSSPPLPSAVTSNLRFPFLLFKTSLRTNQNVQRLWKYLLTLPFTVFLRINNLQIHRELTPALLEPTPLHLV